MNRERFTTLVRAWRSAIVTREIGFALGAACAVAALALAWPSRFHWEIPVAAFLAVLGVRLFMSRPWRLDDTAIARHLDRTHPEIEESSRLWLSDPRNLTLLERLQLRRIDAAIARREQDQPAGASSNAARFGTPPRDFLRTSHATWIIAACALIAVAAWTSRRAHTPDLSAAAAPAITDHNGATTRKSAAATQPVVTACLLTVTPPAYTGLPSRRLDGLNARIEEGASLRWQIDFDVPLRDAHLAFSENAGDSLPLITTGKPGTHFEGTRTVTDPGLYHLAGSLSDGTPWTGADLYSLKIIKDQPPTLQIVQPEMPRTEIIPSDKPALVSVEVAATDDYGLADAHLVATVAKGSGEAVKFREQSFPFDAPPPDPANARPRSARYTRTLDLAALGLEPGDELYFFVEVSDNREPAANRTRSETRFIALKGPTEAAATSGRGVAGINLVPQYFRSERQVIIDTEKLIADRARITDHEFRERADGLGIDQQLLRLRYGQFLGEELEQGTADHVDTNLNPLQASVPELAAGRHAAASMTQRFLQEHAREDREGGSDESRETGAPPTQARPLSSGQVIAPFVDQHDSQDTATLFDRQTKGTMSDALRAMWQAESFLRTIRPEEALAPEHRALDILKDLQQSARAYVQHVGFEAAPIKVAERRLKGDAETVPARADVRDSLPSGDPGIAAARTAFALLQEAGAAPLSAQAVETLRHVEPVLTAAATHNPDKYLAGLQALRRLLAGSVDGGDHETQLQEGLVRQALLKLLPAPDPLPDRMNEPAPALAKSYFHALGSESAEANP